MAKFSFTPASVFRYAIAAAATVNELYNSLRTFTNNAIGSESLVPRSIEHRHYSQAMSKIGSATRYFSGHAAPVGAGDPCAEVIYSPAGGAPAAYQAIAIGFLWPSKTDGSGAIGATPVPMEYINVDWYNSTAGSWDGSFTSYGSFPFGYHLGGKMEALHNNAGVAPIPGTMPPPYHHCGGGPCIVTSRAFHSSSWPPAGVSTTKIGVFGDNSADGNLVTKAELWVFVEDRGV